MENEERGAAKARASEGPSATENLKKGIVYIFIANALSVVVSFVSGFFLPKYLSTDSYAEFKTFSLCISYIGVLHLGYLDGIYIKYGGKHMRDITSSALGKMRSNIYLLQAALSVCFLAASWIMKSPVVLVFALCLIPENSATLYKNLYQATGEYSRYSKVINVRTFITLISYLLLLFVFKTDNYIFYTLVYLANMLVIWVMVEIDAKRLLGYRFKPKPDIKEFAADTKSGVVLMLGNFATILLTGIDRWFVKFLFASVYFAYYSFAVNMQTILTQMMIPLTTALYNYLCKTPDNDKIKRIKGMSMICGLFMISSAFIIELVVFTFIDKYSDAMNVLFILFATQLIYLIIQSVYVNMYKARKQQGKYFKQLMIVLILGAVYNVIFYLIMRSIEGIAIGTLLSVASWYIICWFSIPEIRFGWRENTVLVLGIAGYIAAGMLLEPLVGFAAYIAFACGICLIFVRSSFKETFVTGFGMIKGLLSKLKRAKKAGGTD